MKDIYFISGDKSFARGIPAHDCNRRLVLRGIGVGAGRLGLAVHEPDGEKAISPANGEQPSIGLPL